MKKTIFFAAVAGLFVFSSCASKLDVTPPNSITEEQVVNLMENGDDATKQKIMNAIAAPMPRYLNWWGINGQGVADPCVYCYQGLDWGRCLQGNDVVIGVDANTNELAGKNLYELNYDYTAPAAKGNHAAWFGCAYAINQANLLLNYMTTEQAAKDDLFKDGRARGLVVRAYNYMRLMEDFVDAYAQGGKNKLGMSWYDKYDPKQTPVARSTAQETWANIKADLAEAISLLEGAKIGYTTTSLEDIDLGVAKFLYARACLLTEDWTNCINACKDIINNSGLTLISENLYGGHNSGTFTPAGVLYYPENNAFTSVRKNTECIFGFIRTSTMNGANYHTSLANPFGSYSMRGTQPRIDDRLYNKINDDDFRKDCFNPTALGDYYSATSEATGFIPAYTAYKFAATHGLSDDGTDHTGDNQAGAQEFCQFRLAEVYLMKAEAENSSNSTSDATNTINALLKARTKAGKTALTFANYGAGTDLTKFIQLQWRIEMWGEGGREYFNNKRWGVDVDRAGSTVHTALTTVAGATYPYTKMTLKITQREIEDNNLCVQD